MVRQYWAHDIQAQHAWERSRKGAHASEVLYRKHSTSHRNGDRDGEIREDDAFAFSATTCFHLEQTEGPGAATLPPSCPVGPAESIVAGMPNPPASSRLSGILRPSIDTVTDTVSYCAAGLFRHRPIFSDALSSHWPHSTGHASRLAARDSTNRSFGPSRTPRGLIANARRPCLCYWHTEPRR